MIGVVLWSDPDDRKAVFWCEDQGDLAFYQETACDTGDTMFFAAGDMVAFDTENISKMRKARNARLLYGEACRNLPGQLRESHVTDPPKHRETGRILPFAARVRRDAA